MPRRPGIARTVRVLRSRVTRWRKDGKTVAMVPTMGALHAGHLSLIEAAKSKADRVVVSIFVNPTQFGPSEDLNAYPRDEEGDLAKLTSAGAHLAYMPTAAEMYPSGFATTVHVTGFTEGLCGAARPGHFDGVATVVAKLLLQCAPDLAVFGEKDYQQLLIIRRMVRDLDIPVEIAGAPIVRDEDGLALSSRNAYLTAEERAAAPLLQRSLQDMAYDLAEGRPIEEACDAARLRLDQAGFRPDYLQVADAETLEPLSGMLRKPARIFAAAFLGTTRLIDNLPAAPKPPPGERAQRRIETA